MPLGTVAVSPLELATAYSAFAGLGQVAAPRLLLRITAEDGSEIFAAPAPRPERVMDDGIAFLITNVLREAIEREHGDGRARERGSRRLPPAEAGTTNDATDTWFVGYTPRLVAAVWMGFDEPRPIMGLATGGRLAAPVWGRMMVRAPRTSRPARPGPRRPRSSRPGSIPNRDGPSPMGCRPYDGECAPRRCSCEAALPESICPDQGEVTFADARPGQSDEDDARDGEPWPDDMGSHSHPAPPPEYEEAETWRRAREQAREDAEHAWREARRNDERQLEEWRKEEKRRRREREREQ